MATLEKERRRNSIVMAVGAVVSCAGILLFLMGSKIPGIVVLVVGIAVIMISWTVSNFFYSLDMKNLVENHDKKE